MKNLEFRRQYLISNSTLTPPDGWSSLKISGNQENLMLYYHPDLEVNDIQDKNRSLVLIGYIVDPYHPELNNKEIMSCLLDQGSFRDVLKETESLNGRFAILYSDSDHTLMFHDATGFREIYYCFLDDRILCGSTPNIINQYAQLGLSGDDSVIEFLNSPEYKKSGFWIGKKTPIQEIYHLSPNFYLDLIQKKYFRYWPSESRKEISLKEGCRTMAEILKGTMTSISNRYELYQALTSGWDSRLLLAASKDVKNKTKFVLNKLSRYNEKSADIVISRKMAQSLGIDFEIIDINGYKIDDTFRQIFYRNNIFARENNISVFYDVYRKKLDHTYWVTGTFSNQILRIWFPLKKKHITSLDIATHFKYQNYRYAMESIDEWLKESGTRYKELGFSLTNMFYWEQFTGNVQSLGGTEGDIVREEIRPFNCRKFITTYISLNERYRYKDFPEGHREIIRILWKELLQFPVAAYTNRPPYWMKRIFRLLGMELLVNQIYNHSKTKLYYTRLNGEYRKKEQERAKIQNSKVPELNRSVI
jgi:hypothetical protein